MTYRNVNEYFGTLTLHHYQSFNLLDCTTKLGAYADSQVARTIAKNILVHNDMQQCIKDLN